MKRLYILITVLFLTAFGMQDMQAQTDQSNKGKVYKTTKAKTPEAVKKSLKDYANYNISNEVTFTKKSSGNVYKFKVQKGNWTHFLLINEKGKIIGIETGEHSN